MQTQAASTDHPVLGFPTPSLLRMLFKTPAFAWFWLSIRCYLAYTWISSGLGKLRNPAWVETGTALKGFWTNAINLPQKGNPPIAYDWYRGMIGYMLAHQWYTWFAKLVAGGEFLVGIGMLVGAVMVITAFFGAFMNWNYIMAGSASTNGMLLVLSVLLLLSWRVAGWYGLDRWLLPRLVKYFRSRQERRPVARPSTLQLD